MSLKMSSVRNHVCSVKQEKGVKRLKGKEQRERSIAEGLAAHNQENH